MKNNELLEAITLLEKESDIPRDVLVETVKSTIISACKTAFGKTDNITVEVDPETF